MVLMSHPHEGLPAAVKAVLPEPRWCFDGAHWAVGFSASYCGDCFDARRLIEVGDGRYGRDVRLMRRSVWAYRPKRGTVDTATMAAWF